MYHIEKRKVKVLDALGAEKIEQILDLASTAERLADVLPILSRMGIEVSLATLTRFVRRHREEKLAEDDSEMKEAAEKLAAREGGEKYRKGALETVRQRIYEQALMTNSVEATRKLYVALLKEEAVLKELELKERGMALAEEQVRLQRLRIKLEIRRRGKRKVQVVEVAAAPVQLKLNAGDVELRGAEKMGNSGGCPS